MILTVPLFFRGMKVAAQLFSLSFPDVNKMFQDNSLIPNKGKPISPSVHCLLGLARTRQNSVANLGHVKPGTSILTRRLRWWHHPSTWVITPEKATWVITPENTSCTYISAKFHSHFFHRLCLNFPLTDYDLHLHYWITVKCQGNSLRSLTIWMGKVPEPFISFFLNSSLSHKAF